MCCRICRTGAYWTIITRAYYIREAPAGGHAVTCYGHIYITPTGNGVTMDGDGSCWYSGGGYEPGVTVGTREKWHEDQSGAWCGVQVISISDVLSPHHAFVYSWNSRMARAVNEERPRGPLGSSCTFPEMCSTSFFSVQLIKCLNLKIRFNHHMWVGL